MMLLDLKNSIPRPLFVLTSIRNRITISISAILFVLLIVSILLWISTTSAAQEGITLSGRLIDTTGNPISNITIYTRRYIPQNNGNQSRSDDAVQIKTDAKGRFNFSNIQHKVLKFDIDGSSKIGYEINVLSVEFGEIALYPNRGWHWSSIKFSLDQGTKMENIVVTADIRKSSNIRTRVIFADGTPVANTSIYFYRKLHGFYQEAHGSSRGPVRTDANGYFVEYLSATIQPKYYITIGVEHQGLYAKAVPFILQENQEIVLKLNGKPEPQTTQPLEHSDQMIALTKYLEPPASWAVNPANNHAYKLTHSLTIKEALGKASSEDAYLVAINDEAEEKWLSRVFGNSRYWIGLNDVEEEGNWKWFSGEPVDYTNWGAYEPEGGNTETKDYVMTGSFDWRWHANGDTHEIHNSDKRQPTKVRTILEKVIIRYKTDADQN